MPFATTWMELEHAMLSEIVRERQIPFDCIHIWNLRNKGAKEKYLKKATNQGTDS